MFFNISREKLGSPGQSGDVIDAVWATVSLSLPTHPRRVLHIDKLARTMAQRYNVQVRAFESTELPIKQQWGGELDIDVANGGESLDSAVASSSSYRVDCYCY